MVAGVGGAVVTGMMLAGDRVQPVPPGCGCRAFPGDASVRAAPLPPLGPPPSGTEPERSGLRWARAASVLVGIALAVLIGGVTGVAIGVEMRLACLAHSPGWSSPPRRERLALVRSAPLVADLLAASLSAGVPVDRCLPVVARAYSAPGPRDSCWPCTVGSAWASPPTWRRALAETQMGRLLPPHSSRSMHCLVQAHRRAVINATSDGGSSTS